MIYAVLMVKDEGDVIGGTLAHLVSEGVDGDHPLCAPLVGEVG